LPRDLNGAADSAVFSPNPRHRAAFVKRLENEAVEVVAVAEARAVVDGADIVCCTTNSKEPVLEGAWLVPGQMLITIANSDVLVTRREVDETAFARAADIIINDESATQSASRCRSQASPMIPTS
jgi:ornithine cyclodeaminase/alanine dehydrogenase-like protein (mu-crystallin family)